MVVFSPFHAGGSRLVRCFPFLSFSRKLSDWMDPSYLFPSPFLGFYGRPVRLKFFPPVLFFGVATKFILFLVALKLPCLFRRSFFFFWTFLSHFKGTPAFLENRRPTFPAVGCPHVSNWSFFFLPIFFVSLSPFPSFFFSLIAIPPYHYCLPNSSLLSFLHNSCCFC